MARTSCVEFFQSHRAARRSMVMLPRALSTLQNCDVEGGSIEYRPAVKIVDRPLLGLFVVEDTYRVVVVDAPAATGVPVLGDRQDNARAAVNQRVLQVGGVPEGVVGAGAVDEALGRYRDDYLESCSGGHDGPVLIEDRPLLFICAFVPDAYSMAVGASASGRGASAGTGASPIRGWRDDDDGVGVAVDEGVADVSVVTAAVRVRGGVGEGDLAIRFAGVPDGAGL